MNTQELARELGHPGAQELLRSGSLARLAYNGHDGFPQVALTIDTGNEPATAKALLVRGLVAMDTVDGVPDEYIAAAAKSLDASKVDEFERNVRSMYKQMVRISIEPQWARFYDFGAGRVPAFLANLGGAGGSESATNTAR